MDNPVMEEFTEIVQTLWGVPDCARCLAQEDCLIFRVWGLDGEGRPDVEGCSQYKPEEVE